MSHPDWNAIVLFIVTTAGTTTLALTLLHDVLGKVAELAEAVRRIRRPR